MVQAIIENQLQANGVAQGQLASYAPGYTAPGTGDLLLNLPYPLVCDALLMSLVCILIISFSLFSFFILLHFQL